MNTEYSKTRFARFVLILFVIGAIVILLLELTERLGFISDLFESVGQIVVWIILLAAIAHTFGRSRLDKQVATAGFICGAAILGMLFAQLLEDTAYFADVPFLGRNSGFRHLTKKLLIATWTGSGLFLVYQLISELESKNAEVENSLQQRKQSDERLHMIVSAAPIAIASINSEGVFEFLDGKALNSVGLVSGGMIGQKFTNSWRDYPDLLDAVDDAFMGRVGLPLTVQIRDVTIECRCAPIIVDDQVAGVITVCSDVTERVRAANELQETNQRLESTLTKLERAEKQVVMRERLSALGEMSSGLAHDLNNSLAPVVIYCEMLKMGVVPEEKMESILDAILLGTQQAVGVVKQLQFFYRKAPDDDSKSEREAVDLAQIVRKAISLTRPKWHDEAILNGAKIDLQLDLSDSAFVRGNSVELTQVVTNLLLNAIDAMPQGGNIQIKTTTANKSIVLTIQDDGIGMSKEILARCFEPFFTKKSGGTGLGLSVCHGIISRHDGKIDVTSQLGAGATFHIELPTTQRGQTQVTAPTSIKTGKDLRILVIDDEESVSASTAFLLRSFGLAADVAENGSKGIGMLKSGDYDMIITDLGMSGVSGYDVVQAAKKYDADLPVIVVSGWSSVDVAQQFERGLKPDHIVEKPITPQGIQSVLQLEFASKK